MYVLIFLLLIQLIILLILLFSASSHPKIPEFHPKLFSINSIQ